MPTPKLTNDSISSLNFPAIGYLIFFSMLCMSIMLLNSIMTNRYVSLSSDIFVLGGTLTSPLFFILSDIIAEIFGYKAAKKIIWFGFACQMLFAVICFLVIKAPAPIELKHGDAYAYIFGELPHIVISSFVAFIIASLVNVQIITRWKALVHGRFFWLRSIGSSTFAEALYSAIAIFMMEVNAIPINSVIKVILVSYCIKVCYSIIFAWPTNILVNYIKATTKVDVYDVTANLRFIRTLFSKWRGEAV
jgi:uncharacterized integral membrane protein (TIGR00697 family)